MGHKESRRLEQIHVKSESCDGPQEGDPSPEEIRQCCLEIQREHALSRLKYASTGEAYRAAIPHKDYWPSTSRTVHPTGSIRRGWYCMGSGRYRRSLNYKFED